MPKSVLDTIARASEMEAGADSREYLLDLRAWMIDEHLWGADAASGR